MVNGRWRMVDGAEGRKVTGRSFDKLRMTERGERQTARGEHGSAVDECAVGRPAHNG